MPLNRKHKPRDCIISSDTWDQRIDSTHPPSPSQPTWPRKRGQLSHQPEAPIFEADEDDDNQISGEEDNKKKRWTEAELGKFIHALMGPDGCWEKFTKNPAGAFKKVSVAVDDMV